MEVGITLARYAVLCQTLFQGSGPGYPLIDLLWKLTADVQNAAPFISEQFQQVARTPGIGNVYFACMIRAVQVSTHEHLLHSVTVNVAEGHAGVDTPDFRALVTDLRRGTFHLSNNCVPLPESYLEVRGGSSGVGVVREHPALPQRGQAL